MNGTSKYSERLIWDPIYPAPFESIWSIFHKVIAFNHISLFELRRIIQLKEEKNYSWIDTEWIDFERLGALLKIDPRRLKMGTRQAMGLNSKSLDQYCFRQCPMCWERGYHCILFDLAWIDQCPWHRCKLTTGCSSCGTPQTFSLRTNYQLHLINKRYCTICRKIFPNHREIIKINSFDTNEKLTIIGYCSEFINWWKEVGIRFSERDQLLQLLLYSSKINDRTDLKAASWQFNFARQLTSDIDLYWKFNFNTDPIRLAVIAYKSKISFQDFHKSLPPIWRIKDEAGSCYRSIRRYLYKRFVKKHCHCCKQIRNLSHQEAMALNGESVCTVALTYLIWRMSVENIRYLEGLKIPRADNYELKLMGSDDISSIPLSARLLWTYLSFFGLLYQLMPVNGPHKVKVFITNRTFNGELKWLLEKNRNTSFENFSDIAINNLYIFYPDISIILTNKIKDCKNKRRKGINIINTDQIQSDLKWDDYSQNTLSQENCVITTRNSTYKKIKSFDYILV